LKGEALDPTMWRNISGGKTSYRKKDKGGDGSGKKTRKKT